MIEWSITDRRGLFLASVSTDAPSKDAAARRLKIRGQKRNLSLVSLETESGEENLLYTACRLAWFERFLALFRIHQVNEVFSHNGSTRNIAIIIVIIIITLFTTLVWIKIKTKFLTLKVKQIN